MFTDYIAKLKPVIPSITAIQLDQKLAGHVDGKPQNIHVLDVRETYEWNEYHIPYATYTGRGCLERDVEGIIPDPYDEIIVYCAGGVRSLLAAESLQKLGYKNVFNLEGGIGAWKKAGLTIVKNRTPYQKRVLEYILNNPSYAPTISKEQLQSIINAAKAKKEADQNDPEFAQMIQMLRFYSAQSQAQIQSRTQTNVASPSTSNASQLNKEQLDVLKNQIMAFRLLSTNNELPENLKKAVFDEKSEGSPSLLPQKIVEAVNVEIKNEPKLSVENIPDYSSISNPYNLLPKPVYADTLSLRQQRLLVPAVTPTGLDPMLLLKQREKVVSARIQFRIEELSSFTSNLPNDAENERLFSQSDSLNPSIKLKALIELKSLRLLDKQKKLRNDIMSVVASGTTLATVVDRSVYRRMKKQSVRDARQTEKIEHSQKMEREKREKQKTFDYLNSITDHGKQLNQFHRMHQSKSVKLGSQVLAYHKITAKEEEKRILRLQQDRLKALKENNEEEYLKLIDHAKDTRITTILSQTNQYLSNLTNAIRAQKNSVSGGDFTDGNTSAIYGEDDRTEEEGLQDYYNSSHKITETVTAQASIMVGGTLKEYQLKGLEWMVSLYNNRLNGILADEMGLGKTIQTISLVTYLIEKKKQSGPFLIIVPLSTIANWKLEFDKWAPSVTKVVFKGTPNERKKAQNDMRAGPFNVLLTTFEYVVREKGLLSKIKWVHMIIDEGHRMKNAQSKLSTTLMQHYTSRYRLILTGTPLQNNLPELWALLNFILPKIFNSVKSFDEWFNSPFTGGLAGNDKIELNEEESLLLIKRLHKVLRPFLLRRLKKDVESELPDKVETVIKCNMSSLQLKLTHQLKTRKSFYDGGEKKNTGGLKSLNNMVMQFRKICNHPFVFPVVEEAINPFKATDANIYRAAGKFELLDRILPKYKATNHRVLMFFQMTQIMDIMEDYLRWRGHEYLRLDGSVKAEDRGASMKDFNAPDSKYFIFLLSTRAGGLGLNLQSADTVIIYDSDWNPHQDLQAQDRAHRIGQTKEVRILRLVTTNSIEEHILARAQLKLDLDGKVIQAGKFDNKTSEAEREELLRSMFGEKEENEDEEDVSMNDDELNEIISRNEEEVKIFKEIDLKRKEKDIEDWKGLGKASHYNGVRLMQDSELPSQYLADMEDIALQEQMAADSIVLGRGVREKKEIFYDEVLKEDEWLAIVDSGGDLASASMKKRRSRATKEQGNSDDDEVVEEEVLQPRSRGRPSAVAKYQPEAPKKRRKRDKYGIDPDEVDPVDPAMRICMTRFFNACYDAVESLTVGEGSTERQRCYLFLELPDKNLYKDYYILIKKPIAMDIIDARINSSYYKTIFQFQEDFDLMFKNAMIYNQEGSDVFTDALEMKKVFEFNLKNHLNNGSLELTKEDIEAANQKQQEATMQQQQQKKNRKRRDSIATENSENSETYKTVKKGRKSGAGRKRKRIIDEFEEDFINDDEEDEAYGKEGEGGIKRQKISEIFSNRNLPKIKKRELEEGEEADY
ncbi:hypothetical protein HDU92_002677 [Lobulomyces angularis]|nr:hypothetical protein HDU92_002677 [Lobulomyces angularis]